MGVPVLVELVLPAVPMLAPEPLPPAPLPPPPSFEELCPPSHPVTSRRDTLKAQAKSKLRIGRSYSIASSFWKCGRSEGGTGNHEDPAIRCDRDDRSGRPPRVP